MLVQVPDADGDDILVNVESVMTVTPSETKSRTHRTVIKSRGYSLVTFMDGSSMVIRMQPGEFLSAVVAEHGKLLSMELQGGVW